MKRQWKGLWTLLSAGLQVGNRVTHKNALRSLVRAADLLKPSACCYHGALCMSLGGRA